MHITEVTRKLKVSSSTVSRALNPETQHLVAEKTLRRIHEFVQKSGYVPNRAARELLTGKTQAIGVILPTVFESVFFNDHFVKVLAGVYSVLGENSRYNCKLIILPRGQSLSNLHQQILVAGVDGLLLSSYCDHSIYSSHYLPKDILGKLNKPVVILNLKTEGNGGFSCVYFSNFEASRKAVTFLIQKGHQKIAMIQGNARFLDTIERFEGYKSALRDHNLGIPDGFIAEGNFLSESGYEATLSFFKSDGIKPTAIFCANDEMAIGAIEALRSLRMKCPQDVAVMGFDGIDAGRYTFPRLTTIAQPTKEIAETGTKLLLDLIMHKQGRQVACEAHCELVLRDSV